MLANLKNKIVVLLLLLFVCQVTIAQKHDTKKDSIQVYKNLESYSKKSKFTKAVHRLIFKPVNRKRTYKQKEKASSVSYTKYEGKIIRKINVVTLDPFGYSVYDSTITPQQFITRTGNNLHYKTRKLAIKNLLLFHKNQPLDSITVKESERLLRSQRYIREVRFTPENVADTDSIDINIRVLDAWSTIPDFAFSGSRFDVQLTERNFLGTGHEFKNRFRQKIASNHNAYNTRYYIPNIANTYINTALNYQIDFDRNYTKSLNIERPFFSPLTRWATGIYIDQQYQSDSLRDIAGNYSFQRYRFNTQDFWGGHSFSLFKGKTEEDRTTNLITSARFLRIRYKQAPDVIYDTLNIFSKQDFYMAGIGIASRNFVQDKYIFNYGITEDVPIGRIYGITTGYQRKNAIGRYYVGARLASGDYYKWGYLSLNTEYGTFFNSGRLEDSALSIQATYFTSLMDWGNWKFRQFIRPELIMGFNRNPYDKLSINDDYGIPGFNSTRLIGTKKLLLTFQTQSYAPWELWGFQFGPYISSTFGMLGDEHTGFSKSKVYSQFAVGVIINNRYLVFNSFQLSFAFYPTIPNVGDNLFKTNSVKTTDFDLSDFNFGKPEAIPYH